jgi:hypothetical protein
VPGGNTPTDAFASLLPTDIIKAMVVPTEWRAPNAPETKGFVAPPSEAT